MVSYSIMPLVLVCRLLEGGILGFERLFFGANAISLFFLCVFCFTLSSLFVFKPLVEDRFDDHRMPTLELIDFNLKRLDGKMVFMDVSGSRAKQLSDREIFDDFDAYRIHDDVVEHLSGKRSICSGDMYHFPDGVVYNKGGDIDFFSESGVYNASDGTFQGGGKFSFRSPSLKSDGIDIFYDKRDDTIAGNNVRSTILYDNRR